MVECIKITVCFASLWYLSASRSFHQMRFCTLKHWGANSKVFFLLWKKNSKETCKKGGRGKGWGKYLHNHIIIGQTANKFTKTIRLNEVNGVHHTEVASLLRQHPKWALDLICKPWNLKFAHIWSISQSDSKFLTAKMLPICTNFKFHGLKLTLNVHFSCCLRNNSTSVCWDNKYLIFCALKSGQKGVFDKPMKANFKFS